VILDRLVLSYSVSALLDLLSGRHPNFSKCLVRQPRQLTLKCGWSFPPLVKCVLQISFGVPRGVMTELEIVLEQFPDADEFPPSIP